MLGGEGPQLGPTEPLPQQSLPGVDAVLDVCHPRVLLQGVNGLQDVLSPILYLQAMWDGVSWAAPHPEAKHTPQPSQTP